jgi:Carbonic anhydrase
MEQTPVDLLGAVLAETGPLEVNFPELQLTLVNNGHTIQANCAGSGHTLIAGTRFELVQFHFHHPSEHLVAGKRFPLECHFVHKSGSGQLAVLGVFIKEGAENAGLAKVFAAMPKEAGAQVPAGAMNPGTLLPAARGYYRYAGSLTTPPCSEGVLWTVFREPIEASPAQIAQFAALFPMNARPVQGLGRRYLLESI